MKARYLCKLYVNTDLEPKTLLFPTFRQKLRLIWIYQFQRLLPAFYLARLVFMFSDLGGGARILKLFLQALH